MWLAVRGELDPGVSFSSDIAKRKAVGSDVSYDSLARAPGDEVWGSCRSCR